MDRRSIETLHVVKRNRWIDHEAEDSGADKIPEGDGDKEVTSRGIGGFCRKISEPIHPRTANENTKIAIKISQSRFIFLSPSSPEALTRVN